MFSIRISTATAGSSNLGAESGFAMVLERDGKQVATYFDKALSVLFHDYQREFADEDLWDRDEARAFLFLTEILEAVIMLPGLLPGFDINRLPIQVSCNS